MLTKEDLQSISDLLDKKMDERFTKELGPIREDIRDMKTDIKGLKTDVQGLKTSVQRLEGSVDLLNVKVDRNTRHIKELDLCVRNLEHSSGKKLARLQDGMDTVEEVLKMNDLIPR